MLNSTNRSRRVAEKVSRDTSLSHKLRHPNSRSRNFLLRSRFAATTSANSCNLKPRASATYKKVFRASRRSKWVQVKRKPIAAKGKAKLAMECKMSRSKARTSIGKRLCSRMQVEISDYVLAMRRKSRP